MPNGLFSWSRSHINVILLWPFHDTVAVCISLIIHMHTGSKKYYLGAYLYQARDMYASDRSGLSDPYAIVSCGCYSKRSRVVEQNLCPKWDQTLIFDKPIEVFNFGDTKSLPSVVVDFFDKDKLVKYH